MKSPEIRRFLLFVVPMFEGLPDMFVTKRYLCIVANILQNYREE